MAIFKSSLVSDIRGSIGGSTYARNRAGAYIRNRTMPINPNTVNQSLVRSRLSSIAFGFSTLTTEQVNAWNQFAQGYPAKNKIGDTYTPTGKQVYLLCNLNLLSIGLPQITSPPYDVPVVPGIFTETALVVSDAAADNGPLTNFTLNGITSDNATAVIVVQATPNMQAARQSYRNRMRQISFVVQDTEQDLRDPWANYFGNPNVKFGQIINIRASAVDVDSGVASSWMYIPTTIVETP